MKERRGARPDLGDEPPLVADRRRRPDRRQVSARWLAGTLLTGLTSTALMGIALSAAHDGRITLASPAVPLVGSAGVAGQLVARGERVLATPIPMPRSRRTIEVSTVTMEGDREVIRSQPLAYASMMLGARQPATEDYPDFDPLEVLSAAEEETPDAEPVDFDTGQLYGERVEADVALSVEPFDFGARLDDFVDIGTGEAEKLVHAALGTDRAVPVQVAALQPIDPGRFDVASDAQTFAPGTAALRIVPENVSVAPADGAADPQERYLEEIVPFREERPIAEALSESGYGEAEVAAVGSALAGRLGRDTLDAGEVLRIGLEARGEREAIVRLSAYRGFAHLATVAVRKDGRFVGSPEPQISRSLAQAFDENATEAPLRSSMPSVYDGVYQAALSHGLDARLCGRLIRMLAPDVDYQGRLSPSDRLTVLYSLEAGHEAASDQSEILFVSATFGEATRRYYRFRSGEDGTVDYYDEEGRSARQFLLRNPVPNGRFTSSFGERRHPILGYRRMHWGVDWSAPRGTPILASGAGTVVEAGWSSGYGRHTVIRHPNGYETSYSHQNSIADGIRAGARVRQGQVIGTVGSTGLSTGNHLHYEISVNGTRVDPQRIRLPSSESLEGETLAAFQRERERIDALVAESQDGVEVAGR